MLRCLSRGELQPFSIFRALTDNDVYNNYSINEFQLVARILYCVKDRSPYECLNKVNELISTGDVITAFFFPPPGLFELVYSFEILLQMCKRVMHRCLQTCLPTFLYVNMGSRWQCHMDQNRMDRIEKKTQRGKSHVSLQRREEVKHWMWILHYIQRDTDTVLL